jgi:hypothetical protein
MRLDCELKAKQHDGQQLPVFAKESVAYHEFKESCASGPIAAEKPLQLMPIHPFLSAADTGRYRRHQQCPEINFVLDKHEKHDQSTDR